MDGLLNRSTQGRYFPSSINCKIDNNIIFCLSLFLSLISLFMLKGIVFACKRLICSIDCFSKFILFGKKARNVYHREGEGRRRIRAEKRGQSSRRIWLKERREKVILVFTYCCILCYNKLVDILTINIQLLCDFQHLPWVLLLELLRNIRSSDYWIFLILFFYFLLHHILFNRYHFTVLLHFQIFLPFAL